MQQDLPCNKKILPDEYWTARFLQRLPLLLIASNFAFAWLIASGQLPVINSFITLVARYIEVRWLALKAR
jgi:hypothetical protein